MSPMYVHVIGLAIVRLWQAMKPKYLVAQISERGEIALLEQFAHESTEPELQR